MESAIPDHLKSVRTRTRRIPDDYAPPVPAYVARFKPAVNRVTMAYFGIQYRGETSPSAQGALDWIATQFSSSGGASHWDRARYDDEAGFTNVVSVGYWDDHAMFEAWLRPVRADWTAERHFPDQPGRFIEALSPSVTGYETLLSSPDRTEGIATLADSISGEIQEHAYWGGMRDRLPLSQTDPMAPSGDNRFLRDGHRITVISHDNLCLIRSGQDWTDTEGTERKMYVQDVEPILREGMEFLRDEGSAIGCYANRYMTALDSSGQPIEKSYGMSWWKSLAALERWAESHPTHIAIFGAAMKYMGKLGPAAKLRLYHEVTVVQANEQFFEYINCHSRTGMLKSVDLGYPSWDHRRKRAAEAKPT